MRGKESEKEDLKARRAAKSENEELVDGLGEMKGDLTGTGWDGMG